MLALTPTTLSGCEFSYIVRSAFEQAKLLRARIPLDEAAADPRLTPEERRKLKLALEARKFAESDLGLKATRNYTTYVHLDRPYVSYVVSAAYKRELKQFMWSFPVVGSLPYKGFFSPEEADQERKRQDQKDLDTYVRGVSAYSTLGWFRDPLLSSMLKYEDSQLVNLIIHETTHATLFIQSNADFNERLATFLGNAGTEAFYLKKEGKNSPTLNQINLDTIDDKLFSNFLSAEVDQLRAWYESKKVKPLSNSEFEAERQKQFDEIRERFKKNVVPRLRSNQYSGFQSRELNNAVLLALHTYYYDLSAFEAAFKKFDRDFRRFIAFCRELESAKDPDQKLKEAINWKRDDDLAKDSTD